MNNSPSGGEMVPKFDDQLAMKNRGRTLRAGGPCNWESDDVSAVIKEVTVEQGGVVATSDGHSTTVRKDSNPVWWLDIDSPSPFTYGPAQARAVAVVRKANGDTENIPWPDDVQVDMPLDLENIQGNIVAGFNKDHTSYLFFALPEEPAEARAWLDHVVDQVATAQEVQQFNDLFRVVRRRRRGREGVVEAAWMNLAFTHEGLRKLGVAESELSQFPKEFRDGMRSRSKEVGDVGDSHPDRWPNGLGTRTIHALMIVAADSVEDLDREILYFVRHAASHGVSLVFQQDAMARPDAPGHEHFGFKDGISQPGIRGLTASSYPSGSDGDGSQQDEVGGGEFVLGYPRERAPDPDDDPLSPQPEWTHNGSYLVFRRLRQDVKGFQDFLIAEAVKQRTSVDLLAAKLVGRYRSGASLVGAGNAAVDPGMKNRKVLDKDVINAFVYSTDPQGTDVPRAAHIRKAYPRDQEAAAKELRERPRILRRGLPFGQSFRDGHQPDSPFGANPRFPNDRGLCFVCYQRSIRDQFERIQCTWMNKEAVPEEGDGVDPVASQASPPRLFRYPGGAVDPVSLDTHWVTTTGGEYFFSPSINALEIFSGRPAGVEQK
jgi:Dyp-type peroxidase family